MEHRGHLDDIPEAETRLHEVLQTRLWPDLTWSRRIAMVTIRCCHGIQEQTNSHRVGLYKMVIPFPSPVH